MTIARPVARSGDDVRTPATACLATAYRELFPPLYRYVRFRVGDPSLAEDLVAGVFERALRRLATVRQPEHLRPWLFTIARRAVADHFRRSRPTTALEGVETRGDLLADSPEGEIERQDELRRLGACLLRLPEREREVLGLRFVARLSHREIAGILGLSEANVTQIAHRARVKLRQRLSEEMAP